MKKIILFTALFASNVTYSEIKGNFIMHVQHTNECTAAQKEEFNRKMQQIGHETLLKIQLLYAQNESIINKQYPMISLLCQSLNVKE